MAITWELELSPINISTKEGSLVATRIDSVDGSTLKYEVARAPFNDTVDEDAVWDEVWDKHQARLAKNAAIDNFVGAIEGRGKTNLEARE